MLTRWAKKKKIPNKSKPKKTRNLEWTHVYKLPSSIGYTVLYIKRRGGWGGGPFPNFKNMTSDLVLGNQRAIQHQISSKSVEKQHFSKFGPPPGGEKVPLQNFENLTSDLVLGGQKIILYQISSKSVEKQKS